MQPRGFSSIAERVDSDSRLSEAGRVRRRVMRFGAIRRQDASERSERARRTERAGEAARD